jgi:nucleoside-diphosphate-sugar epimerase
MVPVGAMAFDKGKMFNVNVRSCLNLGEWALARSTPVVHISGAIVYAEPDRVDIDETASTGYSVLGGFYGLTKVLAEDIFRRLKDQGLRLAIVRPSSIYGAGLPATKMLKAFLTTAARDETIELTSPVDDRIDLIHAADVATAVTGVLQAEAWETFNLASGHPSTVLEIANTCLAVTGKGRVLIRDAEEGARNPARRFFLNCKRAQKDLGWTTRVDLKHGLAALYENRVTNLV